jgi:vacuolar protein sorting-associated protein 13A/C
MTFLACSYEPPSIGLVLNDTLEGGLLAKPLRFQEQGQISKPRGMEGVSFWYPVALPGYIAMGCIASKSSVPKPDGANHVCCVHNELVAHVNFTIHSIWDISTLRYGNEKLGIWPVENEVIAGHEDVHRVLHSSGLLPKWYYTFTML